MQKADSNAPTNTNLLIGDCPEETVARCADVLDFLIDAEHALWPGDAMSPSSANGKSWMMITLEDALRHALQRMDENRKNRANR